MTAQRFDRYADMSGDTLLEVSSIIREFPIGIDYLTNMLYGLYDGYLYYDLLPTAKKQTTPAVYARIESVVEQIKSYPTLTKSELS